MKEKLEEIKRLNILIKAEVAGLNNSNSCEEISFVAKGYNEDIERSTKQIDNAVADILDQYHIHAMLKKSMFAEKAKLAFKDINEITKSKTTNFSEDLEKISNISYGFVKDNSPEQ